MPQSSHVVFQDVLARALKTVTMAILELKQIGHRPLFDTLLGSRGQQYCTDIYSMP